MRVKQIAIRIVINVVILFVLWVCSIYESDGPEVIWGILIGLPHHYFPHKTRLPS